MRGPILMTRRHHEYVVVKVFVRSSSLMEKNTREIGVYRHLKCLQGEHPGRHLVRSLVHEFKIIGPSGEHDCLVHEPLSIQLSELLPLLPNNIFTPKMLKAFCRFMLLALDFLHSEAKIIHTGKLDFSPSTPMEAHCLPCSL